MVAYTADGVGHTMAAATAVPMAGSLVNFATAKGIITPASTTAPDAIGAANYTSDFYQFNSGGGSVTLTVHDGAERVAVGTADFGPTLASTLTILDANGNTVATANTNFATLSETITQTLPAGTYYAEVSSLGGETGTFNGSTNTYYDIGQLLPHRHRPLRRHGDERLLRRRRVDAEVFQVDNPGTAAAATNLRTDLANGTDPGVAPTQTTNLFFAGAAAASPLTVTLGRTGPSTACRSPAPARPRRRRRSSSPPTGSPSPCGRSAGSSTRTVPATTPGPASSSRPGRPPTRSPAALRSASPRRGRSTTPWPTP